MVGDTVADPAIERLLGELIAKQEFIFKALQEHTQKLDAIQGQINRNVIQSETNASRLIDMERELETEIRPIVSQLEGLRNKGLGVLFGAALVGGGISTSLNALVAFFRGS